MPIYMDVHYVPGIEARDVAEAHQKDVMIQKDHSCKTMTYWIDEARGVAFCLIEAPHPSMVEEMHRQAHGLMPHKILEVSNELVESFLGRIHDPEEATLSADGLKVFHDPAFRILLVAETSDPVLLQHALGVQQANELLGRQNNLIRKHAAAHGGRLVQHSGSSRPGQHPDIGRQAQHPGTSRQAQHPGTSRQAQHSGSSLIVSFSSAAAAVACALGIQQEAMTGEQNGTGVRIAVSAGQPVATSNDLFGDTIELSARLCRWFSTGSKVAISSAVKDLLAREDYQRNKRQLAVLSPGDEGLVGSLFSILEANWRKPEFNVEEFCQATAMSKSRLYRKTLSLSGLSPNALLKEFRLDKARLLLKRQSGNITETTFDSGFSSPSYFTKCFKKKFGLLPAMYVSLV
jgi:AraC-like DNA-binding protein